MAKIHRPHLESGYITRQIHYEKGTDSNGKFDMEGQGWARVVSSGQSLLSIYRIALSILSYFGRPFEG